MPLDAYQGEAGRAQRIPLTNPNRPAQQATLGAWLITAPRQTPLTSFFQLSIIHLRPIPGVAPAHIRVPGATHELIVCALDPEPGPSVDDLETLHHLTPLNGEVQFEATDELAIVVGELAVQRVCDGSMWAEGPSEYQSQRLWEQLVAATIAHYKAGIHHV